MKKLEVRKKNCCALIRGLVLLFQFADEVEGIPGNDEIILTFVYIKHTASVSHLKFNKLHLIHTL